MSPTNQRRLQLESLERRELMAGNVYASYVGNDLVLSGDANSNGISIQQTRPGFLQVSGAYWGGNSTNIIYGGRAYNGLNFPVPHDANINLGSGNDHLEMGIGDGNVINVPGSVKIYSAGGNDDTTIRNVKTGGDLWIATGTGVDSTYVVGTTTGGSLWAYDGVGTVNWGDHDTATFLSCTTKYLGTRFDSVNSGNDSVDIESCWTDAVFSSLGDGNDYFKMVNTRTTTNFNAQGGNGYDTFFVPDANGLHYNGGNFESR